MSIIVSIFKKELIDVLRDRRTLMFMVVIPILITPLLIIGSIKFQEYQNKKLGSYLLSSAIKNSFLNDPKRVWVHTCSLDHKNALNNYISRGMKIFKSEIVKI